MDWRERIVVDPKILVGKPVIRGTRIAVELVVLLFLLRRRWVAAGRSLQPLAAAAA